MFQVFFIIGLLGFNSVNCMSLAPIGPEELAQKISEGKVRIFDGRSDLQRDIDGFIPVSELLPVEEIIRGDVVKNVDSFKPRDGDARTAVYVADPGLNAKKAEQVLKSLGHPKVRCYLQGIEAWIANGGQIQFPQEVKFEALNALLDEDRILLIDVRNRTELNEVGQIPKSVCLPLHEVARAFNDLTEQEFSDRYGFDKPDPSRKNIVLTCRSGNRVKRANAIMKTHGYNNLRIYFGSFKDWVKKGGKHDFANFDLDYDIL